MVRDWHGVRRSYFRSSEPVTASHLRSRLKECVALPLRVSRQGLLAAWGELSAPWLTFVEGVRQLPCGYGLELSPSSASVSGSLRRAVERLTRECPSPVLALGGGLDSAVVLALWRETGAPLPRLATLRTGLGAYDETERAAAVGAHFDAPLEIVSTDASEIATRVLDAVAAAETPLYNLHPVSRLLLAEKLAGSGAQTLVTGDGADALSRGRPDTDYVPLVAAMTTAGGLANASPFLCDDVVATILGGGPDREKRALRALGRELGLPSWLTGARKSPRFMPPVDIETLVNRHALEKLAAHVDLALQLGSDRQRVGWVSASLLARELG